MATTTATAHDCVGNIDFMGMFHLNEHVVVHKKIVPFGINFHDAFDEHDE